MAAGAVFAERPPAQEGLERFNSLIGEWRGVGQPQRGSNRGAWRQTGEWVWNFENDAVAIDYNVTDGKLLTTARLTHDPKSGLYRLLVTNTEGIERAHTGRLEDNKLVLESSPDDAGAVSRITVTLLNDDRTLVLHEQRAANQQRFFRVAEVGYTRAGVRLARPGSGQPECIVTGGAGTMEVTYQGKTYYVCCSGCKQAFDDDPAGIIAEAAERRKREAAKQD
ncbi:MAG: YHS domain-containing protein [Planctomycetaceae bacterium]